MNAGGVTREALRLAALRKPSAPRVLFADRTYPTPSGRFQLVQDFPREPAPVYSPYPLQLMSISSYRSQASHILREAQLAELPTIWVHPSAAPGVADGADATLSSPLCKGRVRVRHDANLRSDVVLFTKGRWGSLGGPNAFVRARARRTLAGAPLTTTKESF